MTAPEREALGTGLDAMARQIESALDYDVAKRRQEGLETTPDTHLMSPPHWPSHGCLRYWIKALDEARKLLSGAPAVTVTEEMVTAAAQKIIATVRDRNPQRSVVYQMDVAEAVKFSEAVIAELVLQASIASPRKSERDAALEEAAALAEAWSPFVKEKWRAGEINHAEFAANHGAALTIGRKIRALKSTTPQTGSQE